MTGWMELCKTNSKPVDQRSSMIYSRKYVIFIKAFILFNKIDFLINDSDLNLLAILRYVEQLSKFVEQ